MYLGGLTTAGTAVVVLQDGGWLLLAFVSHSRPGVAESLGASAVVGTGAELEPPEPSAAGWESTSPRVRTVPGIAGFGADGLSAACATSTGAPQ